MSRFRHLSSSAPRSHEVHVWLLDRDDINPTTITAFASLLPQQDRERMETFRSSTRRHLFVLTRMLLRKILSAYIANSTPDSLVFTQNAWGKPQLVPNSQALHFNLSHSKDKVVIAVANKRVLGVDIEYMDRSRNFNNIAQHYFHPTEWNDEIVEQNCILNMRRFYKLWTLKEALSKAEGQGLALPFDSFYFSDVNSKQVTLHSAADFKPACPWRFHHQFTPDNYSLAMAFEGVAEDSHTAVSIVQRLALDDIS
ncbi:4'-phosphopantetheinyl transferase superfamily protein [Alteromonas ponticola]|uniref:4'-phosphopantetheinyl transferase superfamily protein n=1 Tax=Alteromonas aquimaris TaxID=2998417 RepID=A0ABT3P820_9ALTE|nr:4'-phosphopantetheinyl transferase superfamily protein [Alteromonas aquimaris]MCW8108902.1 4'-phosphopantetheinyl transferase superfamily protein [Alteromonas aquimaris]